MKAVYLEKNAITDGDLDFSPLTSLMDFTVYGYTTEENKFEHISDAEVVLVNKVIIDEEVFERCPNIKYIGVCATGYNCIDLKAAKKRNIIVTNVPSYSTDSVSQLCFNFILESASKLKLHSDSVKSGGWINCDKFCYWLKPIVELTGKTIGIIGFGNIGRRMAEICTAFKMNIYVYTKNPSKYKSYIREGESFLRFTDLDNLYEKSDYISLHCPMNEETKEMINNESIKKMKDGVVLINVSRGGLVNEYDLKNALLCGKISFYGADVISEEPMKDSNPLLGVDNAVITPHLAWASIEARQRLLDTIISNLKAYIKGVPVNIVD